MRKLLVYLLLFALAFNGAVSMAEEIKNTDIEAELALANHLQSQVDLLEANAAEKQEIIIDAAFEIPKELMHSVVYSNTYVVAKFTSKRLQPPFDKSVGVIGIGFFIAAGVYTVKYLESVYVIYINKDSYEEFKYLLQEKKAELELISASTSN